MEESAPPADTQLDLIRQCLGLPAVDPRTPDNSDSTKPTISGTAEVFTDLPTGFLLEPLLIRTISCKWKKDRKPCGITDVALTDDGRVFVADFLNKAVKIYDSIQVQIFQIMSLEHSRTVV